MSIDDIMKQCGVPELAAKYYELPILERDQIILKSKNGETEVSNNEGGLFMEYYIAAIKILGKTFFCIWYTDVKDGFLIINNKLLSFVDILTLKKYCIQNNIELSSFDITLDDVDFFIDWVEKPNYEINCKIFLDFWNTAADVSDSLNLYYLGNEEGIVLDLYNKLFYGNNLPAVREDREFYTPTWDSEDILMLTKIIKNAISIVSASIFDRM